MFLFGCVPEGRGCVRMRSREVRFCCVSLWLLFVLSYFKRDSLTLRHPSAERLCAVRERDPGMVRNGTFLLYVHKLFYQDIFYRSPQPASGGNEEENICGMDLLLLLISVRILMFWKMVLLEFYKAEFCVG